MLQHIFKAVTFSYRHSSSSTTTSCGRHDGEDIDYSTFKVIDLQNFTVALSRTRRTALMVGKRLGQFTNLTLLPRRKTAFEVVKNSDNVSWAHGMADVAAGVRLH